MYSFSFSFIDIPRFLMNRDIVEPFTGDHQTRSNDFVFCGDLFSGVSRLVDHLDWSEDLRKVSGGNG